MSKLLEAIAPPTVNEWTQFTAEREGDAGAPLEFLDELFSPPALEADEPDRETQETLIRDSRAALSPAQMVERKLVGLLRNQVLPISHLQMAQAIRRRNS
jgi:hypothetical protein